VDTLSFWKVGQTAHCEASGKFLSSLRQNVTSFDFASIKSTYILSKSQVLLALVVSEGSRHTIDGSLLSDFPLQANEVLPVGPYTQHNYILSFHEPRPNYAFEFCTGGHARVDAVKVVEGFCTFSACSLQFP
jgi:hypothetical protein